ncbi:hypothetical protein SALBM311S_10804 [Streptomyces alboniger]
MLAAGFLDAVEERLTGSEGPFPQHTAAETATADSPGRMATTASAARLECRGRPGPRMEGGTRQRRTVPDTEALVPQSDGPWSSARADLLRCVAKAGSSSRGPGSGHVGWRDGLPPGPSPTVVTLTPWTATARNSYAPGPSILLDRLRARLVVPCARTWPHAGYYANPRSSIRARPPGRACGRGGVKLRSRTPSRTWLSPSACPQAMRFTSVRGQGWRSGIRACPVQSSTRTPSVIWQCIGD